LGERIVLNRMPLPAQLDRAIVTGSIVAGAIALPYIVVLVVLGVLGRISGVEIIWWLLAGIIMAGGIGSVTSNNVVHAALALVAAAMGVAGMFLLLASEFLALVQVLVYGGGVAILLLFALMMTNATDDPIVNDGSQKPFGFGVALVMGIVLVAAMAGASWDATISTVVSFRDIGTRLYRDFGVPFEVASLVLLVALIGAIAIARRDTEESDAA
jgi:NADH-quinone oxidoreductase subunit J